MLQQPMEITLWRRATTMFRWSYTAPLLLYIGLHAHVTNGYSFQIGPSVRVIGGRSIRTLSTPISVRRSSTRLYEAIPTASATTGSSNLRDVSVSEDTKVIVIADDEQQQIAFNSPTLTSPGSGIAIPSTIPSYKAILVFVFTTVLIWLTEPLLSLVDTTVVGRPPKYPRRTSLGLHSIPLHTVELASLGPATLLCDTLVYLTYFLAIATTNSLAIATAKQNYTLQISTTSHVLGLGLAFGSIILGIIQVFGKTLLTMILGSEGATVGNFDLTPTVVSSALGYSKIRSLAAPLVVAGIMAQSVCLATLDTVIPAVACLGSTVVNVIGDIWLVYFRGLGARGAAAATAFAGAFSAIILLASVRSKTKHWKRLQDQQLQLNTQIPHDRRKIPFISLPTSTDFIQLAKLCGPIFTIMLAKLICYSAMTIKAADFGMLDMACHSIMLRIFYFFCTLGDSLSQAVQSYLPTLLFGKTNDGTKIETESVGISFLKRMFLLGGLFTVFNAFSSQFILQKLGSLFTTDIQILSLLQTPKYVVSVALGLGLHPIIMLLEGVLMARGDLSFLMKSYGVSMIIMLGQIFMFSQNLGGVWFALVTFQVLRLLSFGLRVWDRKKAMATS